ncbi:MFS transporter [Luteolibacter yonseiensis]|uniref:MFS transporter n=1 Tax=Luteolibacter yonseiensis TaxID=1144680 RepID=A0A934VCS1_9BACT|nr:MFS transporter [Luteolibacter yonseiensis]MBK1817266.1 MFS transporter [Luteolibacter yonseiensis]
MTATDLSGNPRRFVLFTVFYNARAYYPVLAILFLDLGLTLDQFVMLNLIWAATIFLFEVPSGALADTIGRKRLLVASSVLMMVEMLCLLVAPRDGGAMLLVLCVVNRVCSGLSEACASGADEALAYDSLEETDRGERWDKLLATAMRWRSAGYVIAMILGGLIYDPAALNRILPAGAGISADIAHRLPVALVFCQAVACFLITLGMVEPPRHTTGTTCGDAVRLTLKTARWVFTNPKTLVVVVIGLGIDSIVRNFATITSSYYRLIDLPEWSYGFIGAAIGLLGWFVPSVAKSLNARYGTLANLGIAAGLSLLGLAALVPAWPIFGLLPATLLMTTLGLLGFTVSRTLHAEAASSERATVLSVKGLSFNLGYGLFSIAFSRLLAGFPDVPAGSALKSALFWQVPVFAILMAGLFTWACRLWKRMA